MKTSNFKSSYFLNYWKFWHQNQTKKLSPLVKAGIEEILMNFHHFRYFSDPLKKAILELKSANGRILFRLTVYLIKNLIFILFIISSQWWTKYVVHIYSPVQKSWAKRCFTYLVKYYTQYGFIRNTVKLCIVPFLNSSMIFTSFRFLFWNVSIVIVS